MSKNRSFIPAARLSFLTRFYDKPVAFFFSRSFERISKNIPLKPTDTLLDVACGPGALLLKFYKQCSSLSLVGLDIDPDILKIARRKIGSRPIELVEASATDMPFPSSTFNHVTSSLAFHHLTTTQKQQAFQEIHRVLKSGGTFWYFDFAKPTGFLGKCLPRLYRHIEDIEDGIQDRIPEMYKKAGFHKVKTHWNAFGMISLLSGEKE
jgi:ubiquinone/menaquinone biosynthesis C-methylase UbiE